MKRFNVYIPSSLEDAVEFLSKHPDAVPIAGGTDVLVLMRTGIVRADLMLDLWSLRKELSYVKKEDGYVVVGALTTVDELCKSFLCSDKRYLGFKDLYSSFGAYYLRSIATVGGNIGTGHPLSDIAILLMALGGEVKLVGKNGERWVRLDRLYKGKRELDKRPDELIVEVRFRETPEDSSTALLKLDRRRGHAMGYVVTGVYARFNGDRIEDVGIAFDSMGKPYPGRAYKTEEYLRGRVLDSETIEGMYRVLESEMKRITDYRAPAEYRLDLSKVLLKRALYLIKERIGGR